MTAVLVPQGSEHRVLETWDIAAVRIQRRAGETIQWKQVRGHPQRRFLIDTVASIPELRSISVVLCKNHLPNAQAIRDPDYLYNWTFRLMIERLSWFAHDRGDSVAATFAQVRGLPQEKLREYVRRLRRQSTSIQWDALQSPFRIATPTSRRMIQLADTASGGVYAAFERDAYGYTEQTYLRGLRPAIWRRPNRSLWQDGLKYGPWPSQECAVEHPWFQSFCAVAAA